MPREITRIEVPEPEPMHPTPDGGAETQGAAYRLSAPAVATEPLTVTAPDGTALTWVPTELCYRDESGRMDYIVGSAPAGVHVRGREARYQRTFPVADDVFRAEPERVKHWVILHEPPRAPAEYLSGAIEFGVTGLVSGVALPEGRHDEIVAGPFRLPKPMARDLAGKEIEGYYEVVPAEGGQQLFVWFPADAILGAVYPVTIDPTIVTTSPVLWATEARGGRRVALAPDGTIYVLVAVDSLPYIKVFRSVDGGQTWTDLGFPGPSLSVYAATPPGGAIEVDSAGRVHVVYGFRRADTGKERVEHRYYDGNAWSNALFVGEHPYSYYLTSWPSVYVDFNDVIRVAYSADIGNGNLGIMYAEYGGGVWSAPAIVNNPPISNSYDPTLVVDNNGVVHIVWQDGNTQRLYHVTKTGSGFSTPIQINNSSYQGPFLVVDGDGVLHLFAHRPTTYGMIVHFMYTGTWSAPTTVMPDIGYYQNQEITAVVYAGQIHLFWTGADASHPIIIKYSKYEGGTWTPWTNLAPASVQQRFPTVPSKSFGLLPVVWTEGNASPYGVKVEPLLLDQPPSAPSLSPRSNFDAADEATFEWTFSDPDPGDTQSAYQLIIKRASGEVVYDTGKVVSSAQQHVLPAGTLQNGAQYRWTVRTWDKYDREGPYAAEQAFYTSAKPVATITNPATDGETVANLPLVVQWTVSDPESKGQGSYRVVLKDGTGAVVHDSGQVQSAVAQSYAIQSLQDQGNYTIELTVWDGDGVASVAATRTFVTSFTPPPTPDVTVEALEAWVRITIANNNAGAEVLAVSNDVYRRKVGEAGSGIRIATNVPVDGVVYDYAVASGVAYEYRVVAIGGNGTSTASAWTPAPVLSLRGAWLHDPADPAGTVRSYRVAAQPERGEDWEPERALMQFAGRTYPVAEFGEAEDRLVRCSILVLPDRLDDLDALRALAARRSVVCYRDSAGRRIFGVLGPLRIRDERHGGYTVDLEITAVDYDEAV